MSDSQEVTVSTRKQKPALATAQFIFIGDPNDNGRGSRAPRFEDDEEVGTASKMFGIRFPLGKAVSVPLDARIGTSPTLVVDKLRANTHFFEGSEAEFIAAKAAGEIKVRPAPKKVARLVKYAGMRKSDMPNAVQNASSMDD